MSHAKHRQRFEKTWGMLAKSVLELAFEDLNPVKDGLFDGTHLNVEKVKEDARRFFESRRYRPWADASGFSRDDCEQAYLDLLDNRGEVG